MQKNKGKEVLGKAMRIKAAVDTGGMSEVVRGAKNVLGKPGQERRKARRAARKAKRAAKYGGGTAMKKTQLSKTMCSRLWTTSTTPFEFW